MAWISIILWIVTNLPELISLLRGLFTRKTGAEREQLRRELSGYIQSAATRDERKTMVRTCVMRVMGPAQ